MSKPTILLVDGMALLFRGFFATSFRGNFMRNSEGIPTNGMYQYLKYMLNAIETFNPTHVVCCWDMGSKTFRTDMMPAYKANRSKPPEELVPQFDRIKEIMDIFAIPNVGLVNYEADDCIGTLAREYAEDNEVMILTGDHDMLQLVDSGIQVAIMKKGQGNYDVFTHENFLEKKGIVPRQVIDMKALMGDSADNYPGVKGIGEKTALKLVQEYETIDNLLENIDQLPKGVQTKIKANIDMLHLSRELAEIKCDVPITCKLDDALWNCDNDIIGDRLRELNFTNLAKLV
ncbi:5'-3' exonuclease [Virgibacillus necropolis]|uniref:5'-3' exonuclease n=1 Tax=Virgibacillus necropolis TaxID=163877 RepID=A0A221MDA6_9BACI|nr:5'-3' exonuclease H3TH domain-containing protein [Virgibacillus necropolis]ASN05592.1 flap endonuclease [Virgibacillus necropolis]